MIQRTLLPLAVVLFGGWSTAENAVTTPSCTELIAHPNPTAQTLTIHVGRPYRVTHLSVPQRVAVLIRVMELGLSGHWDWHPVFGNGLPVGTSSGIDMLLGLNGLRTPDTVVAHLENKATGFMVDHWVGFTLSPHFSGISVFKVDLNVDPKLVAGPVLKRSQVNPFEASVVTIGAGESLGAPPKAPLDWTSVPSMSDIQTQLSDSNPDALEIVDALFYPTPRRDVLRRLDERGLRGAVLVEYYRSCGASIEKLVVATLAE